MTPREAIRNAAVRLAACDVPDSLFDAACLLSFVTGQEALFLRLDNSTQLSPDVLERYDCLCSRREKREPLQYILGSVFFLGHEFRTDPRALIPRPETELLAERVIDLVKTQSLHRALDLCCGTGCIGISVRLACPSCTVTLADLSPDALALARENADRLNADVRLVRGDLFAPVAGEQFDLIVSNPPYIPSEECLHLQEEVLKEPDMALDGGKDGLDFYQRIAADAPRHLKEDGHLLLEIGDGEADAVVSILQKTGFQIVSVDCDYQSLPRMIHARLPIPSERSDIDDAGKV